MSLDEIKNQHTLGYIPNNPIKPSSVSPVSAPRDKNSGSTGVRRAIENKKEEEEQEEYKRKAINLLRKGFGVETVPELWLRQLEKAVETKPSWGGYRGVYYILWYAFEIRGYEPFGDLTAAGVLTMFEEEAKQYNKEQKEVRDYNARVEIVQQTNNVKIFPPKSKTHQPQIKIEDL